MSTRSSTTVPADRFDDGEDYVLIDARAILLDLADQPNTPEARPMLRGAQPPPPATSCDPEVEWRAFLGATRRDAGTEQAASLSLWRRMTRRLQGVWGGAGSGAGREQ